MPVEHGEQVAELVVVRSAGVDDLPYAAAAFGAGSLDEAVYSWVIPDEATRRERLAGGADELANWLGGVLETGELVVAVPVYLEASSPRNRALYERHGFRDHGEPIPLPGGPRLQPMWRTPGAALNAG